MPSTIAGPSPYYELRGLLFSGNIGQTNYERYKSSATDALFNKYPAVGHAQQVQIIHQIQKTMVDQAHYVVLFQPVYQVAVSSNIKAFPLTAAGWLAELGGAQPA